MNTITLSGENRFLVQSELDNIVHAFVEQYGEMSVERIDGEEASLERIKESLVGTSLFAQTKLVVIRHAEANKQFLEHLEQLLSAIPEATTAVLMIPKIDKRAKYYKVLQKMTDLKVLESMDTRTLAGWVVKQAKTQNATISMGDAQYLIERVGTNQAIVKQELDKLILHNSTIDRSAIDELTEPLPQSTVFELLDAAFGGNHKRAMALYEEQRQLKTEPLAILGMIAWQLHILAIVMTAKGKSPGDIAKEAKVHPFVVNKSASIARKLSYGRLKELINQALNLDIRLKSQTISADDALKHYLLSLG